jgi:hypothetical protein
MRLDSMERYVKGLLTREEYYIVTIIIVYHAIYAVYAIYALAGLFS